jgi:transcriptional regulator with XRE-family HTH domain
MITKLGKELRKLRLDLGITLHDMATRSGVSSSLLSSAETGKKTATPALIDKLAAQFEHVRQNKASFLQLAEETKTDVRIRLSESNDRANGVALAFARNFDSLSSQQLEQLMAVFNNSKKGN